MQICIARCGKVSGGGEEEEEEEEEEEKEEARSQEQKLRTTTLVAIVEVLASTQPCEVCLPAVGKVTYPESETLRKSAPMKSQRQ
jgi:hypothetical protein